MTNQKETSDVVALVCDYSYFASVPRALAPHFKQVYYATPIDTEFKDVDKCVIGDGQENVERMDDWLAPKNLANIDLIIFPDLDFSPLQQHLRDIGKSVWGSMAAADIELYRSGFLKLVERLGLPVAKSKTIYGVSALAEHLKSVDDQWVKVNRFRMQTETFHHQNFAHSAPKLDSLAKRFGGVKEKIVFVVQDHIETGIEIGYDGWCIDGQFPDKAFAGFELKNELYLGALLDYSALPEQVREVNAAMAPVLKECGYRNFMSTEIRVKDGVGYFIDPTMRCAGLTMEHQFANCENIADVIWHGSNGDVVQPKFVHSVAAEATLHYDNHEDDSWKVLNVPESSLDRVFLSGFCFSDGLFHFPPAPLDEVGVVIGLGGSIDESIADLKENFDVIEAEPISIRVDGFNELLESIHDAEAAGMKFSDSETPTELAV